MTDVTALVLAAGAGRRYGGPKALARAADGTPWLTTVTATLASAGLESVAVLPRPHPESADLLSPGSRPLFVDTYTEGIGSSLRAGLTALAATAAQVALVVLTDQPALPLTVIARVLTPPPAVTMYRITEPRPDSQRRLESSGSFEPLLLGSTSGGTAVLRRAVFDGRPGHPVLIGRVHWDALIGSLTGDEGAGPYFRAHHGERIECADLWDGADIDEPAELSPPPSHITEIPDFKGLDPHERVKDPQNLRDSGS